jgi:hypothetical protein
MKQIFLFSLSFLIFACNSNDTSLKKGVSWGMSMNQVSNQYKTNPTDKGSELLEYKENYYSPDGGQVQASYRYRFDSQNGLVSYNIFAHSSAKENNEAVLHFVQSKISEIGGTLSEQEENYIVGEPAVGGGFVLQRKLVFDRLYVSTKNEAVRVILEYNKQMFGSDSTYDLTISCLAPGWALKESPSSRRQAKEVKSRKK